MEIITIRTLLGDDIHNNLKTAANDLLYCPLGHGPLIQVHGMMANHQKRL